MFAQGSWSEGGTGFRAQVCLTQDPTLFEAVWAEQKDLTHYFY